jgi:hypothetical protein
MNALLWPGQGREFSGTGVVEIDAGVHRLAAAHRRTSGKARWGAQSWARSLGKVEQAKQVVGGSELNASALQSHKQIGHVVGAARQLSPLLPATAVHVQEPVGRKGRFGALQRTVRRFRRLFRRLFRRPCRGQLPGGLQHTSGQRI